MTGCNAAKNGMATGSCALSSAGSSHADDSPKEGLILLVIPAKAGIQCLQATEHKGAGFLLSQE